MTDYYLVNAQDNFASGYCVDADQLRVATVAGFEQALVSTTDSPEIAKYALYAQVVATAAAASERSELSQAERITLAEQLDAQFQVQATSDLTNC